MKLYTRTILSLSIAGLLVACGGSSNSSSPIVDDPDPTTPFFNDQADYQYANSLLGKFGSFFRPFTAIAGEIRPKAAKALAAAVSLDCVGGGSIVYDVPDDLGANTTSATLSFSFNNCIEDGETANGSISLSTNLDASGDNGTVAIQFNQFSVTGGADDVAMNGSINMSTQLNGDQATFSISGSSLSMTAGSESIVISDYNMVGSTNELTGASSLSGAAVISSSVDGTVTVEINPAMTLDDLSGYPVSGQIAMTHSDGSSLTIDADTGDTQTFSYVINDNGSITSGIANWSDTEFDFD